MSGSIFKLPDKDMQNALKALVRAAARAKELARQTRTEFVVIRDGKLVREIPPLLTAESKDEREAL